MNYFIEQLEVLGDEVAAALDDLAEEVTGRRPRRMDDDTASDTSTVGHNATTSTEQYEPSVRSDSAVSDDNAPCDDSLRARRLNPVDLGRAPPPPAPPAMGCGSCIEATSSLPAARGAPPPPQASMSACSALEQATPPVTIVPVLPPSNRPRRRLPGTRVGPDGSRVRRNEIAIQTEDVLTSPDDAADDCFTEPRERHFELPQPAPVPPAPASRSEPAAKSTKAQHAVANRAASPVAPAPTVSIVGGHGRRSSSGFDLCDRDGKKPASPVEEDDYLVL